MGRQLIPMRMGMGIMPGRQCRFYLGVVGRMRIRVVHGVVMFLLIVTFLILARLRSEVGLRVMGVWFGFVSW
jgi:hypothetical protein